MDAFRDACHAPLLRGIRIDRSHLARPPNALGAGHRFEDLDLNHAHGEEIRRGPFGPRRCGLQFQYQLAEVTKPLNASAGSASWQSIRMFAM